MGGVMEIELRRRLHDALCWPAYPGEAFAILRGLSPEERTRELLDYVDWVIDVEGVGGD